MLVNSVPVSMIIVSGLPRRAMTASSSRPTRTPDVVGAYFTKPQHVFHAVWLRRFRYGKQHPYPLRFSLPTITQAKFGMIIMPVQRDGGQKLNGNATPLDKTRRASLEEMEAVTGR
jgi:hypothetical protein